MSQFGNHCSEESERKEQALEEEYRREREQGIYRSEYNSQIDH